MAMEPQLRIREVQIRGHAPVLAQKAPTGNGKDSPHHTYKGLGRKPQATKMMARIRRSSADGKIPKLAEFRAMQDFVRCADANEPSGNLSRRHVVNAAKLLNPLRTAEAEVSIDTTDDVPERWMKKAVEKLGQSSAARNVLCGFTVTNGIEVKDVLVVAEPSNETLALAGSHGETHSQAVAKARSRGSTADGNVGRFR